MTIEKLTMVPNFSNIQLRWKVVRMCCCGLWQFMCVILPCIVYNVYSISSVYTLCVSIVRCVAVNFWPSASFSDDHELLIDRGLLAPICSFQNSPDRVCSSECFLFGTVFALQKNRFGKVHYRNRLMINLPVLLFSSS